MFHLDRATFCEALAVSPYKSISALARQAGIHRNSIYHYLKGGVVLPSAFIKLARILRLEPQRLLGLSPKRVHVAFAAPFAQCMDALHQRFPKFTFVLFGSRARGDEKKYSDYDIGIINNGSISHDDYLLTRITAEELCDDSLLELNLVNLTAAPRHFIKSILPDLIFLQGSQTVYNQWLRKTHE